MTINEYNKILANLTNAFKALKEDKHFFNGEKDIAYYHLITAYNLLEKGYAKGDRLNEQNYITDSE